METYSFTGSLTTSDDDLIDVCLFENLPFSEDYTVVTQWRAGDIFSILIEEGHLLQKDRMFAKITSVKQQRYYELDSENPPKNISQMEAMLVNEYTVGLSTLSKGLIMGQNIKMPDLDIKIRDKKIDRIL